MDAALRIDHAIISLFGHIAQSSPAIDRMALQLLSNEFLKGGVVIALMWWVWFQDHPASWQRRVGIVKAIVAGLVATGLSQLAQNFLPARPRPMHGSPGFVPPAGLDTGAIEWLRGWSSLPSDHATLFFALAVGLWLVDRRFGVFALLWSLFVVCLPRIYFGFHYPSDIIAGGLLGAATAALMFALPFPDKNRLRYVVESYPAPFYTAAFLVCFELGQLFQNARTFLGQLLRSVRLLLTGN